MITTHKPESDSEIITFFEEESSDLRTDLAIWAVKRSLLGTPPQIEVRDLCGGQFLYFGMETGLRFRFRLGFS